MRRLLGCLIIVLAVLIDHISAASVSVCSIPHCNIECSNNGDDGCRTLDMIDASKAGSVKIDCTSKSASFGGCQGLKILCPKNGECIINCNDYYGCYGTDIIVDTLSLTNNASLILNCKYPDSSCTDTIIRAPNISSLNINCGGYLGNTLSSLSTVTCHNMQIFADNIQNTINFNCSSDYSCSDNILYANNSQSVISITSIGLYSFYNNIIYAQQSSLLYLFCGSEAYTKYNNNQFGGCIKSKIYAPSYTAINNISRTIIKCEGEGCYGPLDIYSIHGVLDLNISLNGCSECDENSCINQWNFHCDTNYKTEAIFSGDSCIGNEDNCHCKHAVNTMNTSFIQNDMECDIFSTDYICPIGKDCIIDCSINGCKDKLINGAGATSLHVLCNGNDLKSCKNARISCPNSNHSECHVLCNGHNSCFELEIHATKNTQFLNVTCIEKDACSYTEINALYAYQINMDCIVNEACDNFNIYANYSTLMTLTCRAQDIDNVYSSSYAACNNFNIYVTNNKHFVMINCYGDFSCYYPNIYAQNAFNLILEAQGQYAIYYGFIDGRNIESLFKLICRSEFGEQGCYRPNIYVPIHNGLQNDTKKMSIHCEGHGCFYLNLYAINGYNDIDIKIDGCSECDSVDHCVQNWYIYCGQNIINTDNIEYYTNIAIFDGLECHTRQCQCPLMLQNVYKTFENNQYESCSFFQPNIVCDIDKECIIDCHQYEDGCNGKIISGSDANSLVVNCNNCSKTTIYCPTDKNSRCDIKCVNKNSCYLTEINGDEYNLINIDCLIDGSCLNSTISAPDAAEVNILCFESNSCESLEIDAKFANIVNLVCTATGDGISACNHIDVIATNVDNVFNLECDGLNACKNMYIYAEYANITNINMIGWRALYSGEIHMEYTNKVNILSFAENAAVCVNDVCSADIYLPKNNSISSIITCQGYGCYNLNLYSLYGLTDYSFKLNSCGLCKQEYYCYANWHIFCGNNNYENSLIVWSGRNGMYCSDDICGCTQSMDILSISWDTYNSGTCQDYNNYNYSCKYDENGYCIIDCSVDYYTENGCSNKIINTTNQETSIIINCGSMNEKGSTSQLGLCENTKIYCPKKENTECIVNCIEDDSCSNAKIYNNNNLKTNTLWLNCSDYGSCQYTKIIAPNLKQIDIFCDNTDACYGLNVEATYVDTMNIICTSSQEVYDYNNYYWEYEDVDDVDGGRRRRRRRMQTDYDWNIDPDNNWYGDYDWIDEYDYNYQSQFACDQIVIDANYSKNLNIICNGNNSCYYSFFYGDYAENVNLTAIGEDSMYYGYLLANNASDLYIKCWSAYDYGKDEKDLKYYSKYVDENDFSWFQQGACDYAFFFVPTHSQNEQIKTNFICQGYGCFNLNIYSMNGLRDINISIDGCKVCDSINDCIGKWSMQCGHEFNKNDYYDGEKCHYGQCDCHQNQITYKDTKSCAYHWNHWNITQNATNNNNNNGGPGAKTKIYAVISVIIGVILICMIYIYCYNKRKQQIIDNQVNPNNDNNINNNNNNKHEPIPMDIRYDEDDNNITTRGERGNGTTKNDDEDDEELYGQYITPSTVNNDKSNNDDNAALINNDQK